MVIAHLIRDRDPRARNKSNTNQSNTSARLGFKIFLASIPLFKLTAAFYVDFIADSMDENVRPHNSTAAHHWLLRITQNDEGGWRWCCTDVETQRHVVCSIDAFLDCISSDTSQHPLLKILLLLSINSVHGTLGEVHVDEPGLRRANPAST
ncbi:hypothetical protein Ccrd_021491 [Cynara cardunculus var. scolymus]|uniref:Uncharacterized protein n=1 Tax=Cynara cardunculus var. scolymus TaxID=59895 RepID=A0A103Y0F2_CYNCS|nr:hypothetical protein Ccrd_021491 [Cynara cardunculus var. scolymus]